MIEKTKETEIPVGTKVVDRDGYRGTVMKVTYWEGSRWYDVLIFDGTRIVGEVVRYDGDLTVVI